jgi:hypothetical protein
MWGAGGPFLPAGAMVVAVVTPVVFCNKATENCNKNNYISSLDSFSYVLLHIAKHIAVHVTLLVAWPEPECLAWPARTTLVQRDPCILGIARKLLSSRERLAGCTEAKT